MYLVVKEYLYLLTLKNFIICIIVFVIHDGLLILTNRIHVNRYVDTYALIVHTIGESEGFSQIL